MRSSYSKKKMKGRLNKQNNEFYKMLNEMRDQKSVEVPSQNQTIMDLVRGSEVKKYNMRSMIRPSKRKKNNQKDGNRDHRKNRKDSEQVLESLDVVSYKNRMTPKNNLSSIPGDKARSRHISKHHLPNG